MLFETVGRDSDSWVSCTWDGARSATVEFRVRKREEKDDFLKSHSKSV